MEFQHVNIKLYFDDSEDVELESVIPVFHSWIQDHVCEELMVDVADYRHVFGGPGVILVGLEADYSLDKTDHRLGVRYNRKAALAGDNQKRFEQACKAALKAYRRLKADPRLEGKICFNGQEVCLFVNDRMFAPNLIETYETAKPELESFFGKLFRGDNYSLQHNTDPRGLFSVLAKASRRYQSDELLSNLQ